MEISEQCVISVQSQQYRHQNNVNDVILMFLLLTLNEFHESLEFSLLIVDC